MPLSATSKKVMKSMQDQYGKDKGESVFYATANKKGGKAEESSTWKKKKKAAEALSCVLCKVAHVKQADFWSQIQPYLPYLAAGGLGGLALGDSDTPWWQRLLTGALMGGAGGYGINDYLLPWLNQSNSGAAPAAEEPAAGGGKQNVPAPPSDPQPTPPVKPQTREDIGTLPAMGGRPQQPNVAAQRGRAEMPEVAALSGEALDPATAQARAAVAAGMNRFQRARQQATPALQRLQESLGGTANNAVTGAANAATAVGQGVNDYYIQPHVDLIRGAANTAAQAARPVGAAAAAAGGAVKDQANRTVNYWKRMPGAAGDWWSGKDMGRY